MGVLVACSTAGPHTAEGYVSEMRGAMPDAEQGMVTDQQIITTGRMMCAFPESLNVTTAGTDATAEYVEYTKITKGYCDVIGADPIGATQTAGPTTPQPVALGRRFDVLESNGVKMADAAFSKIEVDADCSESRKYSSSGESKPTRGHFIAVTMDVATTPEYSTQSSMQYPTDYDFSITGPDGYAETSLSASAAYCVPFDDTFNAPLAPSSKYKRTILLDAKNATGTLTYKPHSAGSWPGVTVPLA